MSIDFKILNSVAEIFDYNYSDMSGKDFYLDLLRNINSKVECGFLGAYFLDETYLSKKAEIYNSAAFGTKSCFFEKCDFFLSDEHLGLLRFLNSKEDKTFVVKFNEISKFLSPDIKFNKCNFLFSKLLIKNSFFGFIFLAKEGNFSDDEISVINLMMSVYSYIIKDFELNMVFKMQLNLLQDAVEDKENAYKTIEKQNKKLIQADSARASFLANVSHELRTPLNAIMGFSDVLLSETFGKLNDKQSEYIKDINLSSVHLMGLINSLLDFSKIESGAVKLNLSEFEPKRAVDEVINLLNPLLSAKEINLVYDNDVNDAVCADFQKFQQILFNLIGNAIKFSKQKGKIIVRTKDDGEYLILEVEDFGIGIEKKYHNFIFRKFTQIDNIYTKTGTSTGLGLAIVKEYVKLHKGKVYVESKPSQGSTFVVKLRK